MADIVDKQTRSRMMAGIRGRDTRPEIWLRSALHRQGFRFKLQDKCLPGRPDVVLPRYRVAVQVHGCFWHRHEGCRLAATPKTRPEFWERKFKENVSRDARNNAALLERGWRVAIVWECGLRPGERDQSINDLIRWISTDSSMFETALPSGVLSIR